MLTDKQKRSDLFRRLRFYGLGLLMGMLIVSFLTKGKACQLPSTLKLEELNFQQLEYSKHALCRMQCRNITANEVKQAMVSGSIDYGKSEVHDKPWPTYAIEGVTAGGKELRIIIADCDTMSRVVTTIDLKMENDTCKCD